MAPTYAKPLTAQWVSRATLTSRQRLGGEVGGNGGIMRVRLNTVGLSRFAADYKTIA